MEAIPASGWKNGMDVPTYLNSFIMHCLVLFVANGLYKGFLKQCETYGGVTSIIKFIYVGGCHMTSEIERETYTLFNSLINVQSSQ